MKMFKFLTVGILSLMILGGCAAPAKEEGQELVKPEGEVTISVWYALSGASGEAFHALVEEFNEANPDINIELTFSGSYADTASKISANLATNTAPDVALMAAAPLYTGGRGDFLMEELIEDPEFNKDDIYEGIWEYAKYDGRISAIPYGISTQVLYYNKDIIDAAGIDMTTPPTTWEELAELAKTAKEKGNISNSSDFWGLEVSDAPWLFKSMLNQNGNSIITQDGEKIVPVYNDEKAVEVGEFWKKLIEEGILPAGEHDNAEKKFLSGNVAFMVASSNRVQRWTAEPVVNLGAIPMPAFENKSLALGGNVLAIFSKDSGKRYAAWELIKFLTNQENQTEFALNTGYLPIRKSAADTDIVKTAIEENPLMKISIDQLQNTWAYWHFQEMGTMDFAIYDAIEAIEKGVSTPKEALDAAVDSLQKEME